LERTWSTIKAVVVGLTKPIDWSAIGRGGRDSAA
jgi:hypothetical protein